MENLIVVEQSVQEARRKLERKQSEHEMLLKRQESLSKEIVSLKDTAATLDKVTVLLNNIGEQRQQEAQQHIEGIITRGLQTIFGPDFSFHIVQTMKGKSASVEFMIRSKLGEDTLETPVLESHGGGLAAIVGFLLRVTVMLLDKYNYQNRVMILDETFGMVSAEYLDALAEFVQELTRKAEMQVILVTHQNEWESYADKVYRFGIRNGATFVKEEL